MTKSIFTFIALSLLTLTLVSCASSGGSKKSKRTTLYSLIKDNDYTAATDRLATLYAAYPNGAKEEKKFIREVQSAVRNLPKKHKAAFDGFMRRNRDGVAEKFMSALYFQNVGIDARGTKFANKTEKKKLDLLGDNLTNSVARFQSVLKDDPNSYLAHMYNGVNYSYLGRRGVELTEFRSAVDLNPTSIYVWNNFLTHSQPRWGGSYEMMQGLIDELSQHEQENPDLRSLKGMVLSDKASAYMRQKDYASAEQHIFEALEFGSNYSYGQTVDRLMRNVKASGDEEGACRIIKKTLAIYPDHKRYGELADSCG